MPLLIQTLFILMHYIAYDPALFINGKRSVAESHTEDRKYLYRFDPCNVILKRENFADIVRALGDTGIDKCDLLLADLGWCSGQITDADRGMSFQQNMPLNMRLDDRLKRNAADIVNKTDEKELADIIYN